MSNNPTGVPVETFSRQEKELLEEVLSDSKLAKILYKLLEEDEPGNMSISRIAKELETENTTKNPDNG